MKLPVKHLSARVPWHDHGWDGSVCKNPGDNSFCRVLPNIDAGKNVEHECRCCAQRYEELDFQPPCIGEKGGFLSITDHKRVISHNYKKNGNKLFQEFRDVTFIHRPFSINAVPFRWMLKDKDSNVSEMAQRYDLDYNPQKEEELCAKLGFRPTWVQHRDNQRIMLDSFFSCLEPNKSLIFFYAKHTPLSEINQKVIIGAAYVKYVGDIMDFEYPSHYNGHRAYVWDRLVYHSLMQPNDGCILPYFELIEYETIHPEESHLCRDCVCFAPNHEQFSHASELVENDVAIDALFELYASFKKAGDILKQDYSKQLEWLDAAISHVWEMRGAFPSMGSVLTAKEFEGGNSIAWRIEQYIVDTYGDIYGADPWEIFDKCINENLQIPGLSLDATVRTQWNKALKDTDKKEMRLLSRIQMNEQQAKAAIEIGVNLENPYTLFENLRRDINTIPFSAIDKACYPAKIIAELFPITESPAFDDRLDMRRVRTALIFALENFADMGNTLVVQDDLFKYMDEAALSTPMPLTAALLESYCDTDFFSSVIVRKTNAEAAVIKTFYKLFRLETVRIKINQSLRLDILERRQLSCVESLDDYRKYLDRQIPEQLDPNDDVDVRSRQEKAEAMAILAKYRFSVLVGPAGSGKTTLLKAFCTIPSVASKSVVMLAPTGKARVNMSNSAQTIAQYLYKCKRYNIFSGQYYMNPDQPRESCGTLIIDEASMLTEEQLAAVLDAVIAERILLIGDYKQLPPIGAGRPFFDIVQRLKPDDGKLTGTAYAEITNISRQRAENGGERLDVKLSKFFGNPQKEDFDHIQNLVEQIQTNSHKEIRLVRWDSGEDLQKKIISTISEHLGLNPDDLCGSFENVALGRVSDKFFNFDDAEKKIESWQIMSPLNGHAYGVKEINKAVQSKFRQDTIKRALQNWSAIPAPVGRDNFVYGDKVINLGNRSMHKNSVIARGDVPSLNYMANGEIGIVVGQWKGKGAKGKPNVWISFSSQQGYAYSFFQTQFGEDEGAYDFELAYCISVHKSQGSGFGQTFLVLPANNPILSRELLYTALTRQKNKVVILHQGEFPGFLKYASDEYSETARRLTDLFELPTIQVLNQKTYDSRYVNITQRGEHVISKSEAVIANILYGYERQGDITYVYEDKYRVGKDRSLTPDFIIEHISTGRKFIWEHLGLMNSNDYRKKWELKKQAYLHTGAVLAENATIEDDVVLITSEDAPQGGIDSQEIERKIKKYILL